MLPCALTTGHSGSWKGHLYAMAWSALVNAHWTVEREERQADLPLLHAHSRRLISLEKRRSDTINSPLDFCEHLREPRCPKELVRSCPMAGGMKPDPLLVHRLCAPSQLDLRFAPSTRRVRDWVAVLHASPLLRPHRREPPMLLTPREPTSPHRWSTGMIAFAWQPAAGGQGSVGLLVSMAL